MRFTKPSRLATKNYLQISAFLDLVVIEQGGFPHSIKSCCKSHKYSGEKTAGQKRLSLNVEMLTSASIRLSLCGGGPSFCVVKARFSCVMETAEGLDVILNDPASLRR